MSLTLHFHPLASFCHKALIALYENDTPFERRIVNLMDPADAAAFNKKVKVLFLGIGSEEGPGTKTFSDQLTQAGIRNVFFESPGTAHEWLTWRRCLKEFAPRLFR
jgi:S-formylglutathione hydrolase FrmB